MSAKKNSSPPPPPASTITEANPAAALRPVAADGRTRVLCPAGLDPAADWPAGRGPLLAYVIYSNCPRPTGIDL